MKKQLAGLTLGLALTSFGVAQANAAPEVEKDSTSIVSTDTQAKATKIKQTGWKAPGAMAQITSTSEPKITEDIKQVIYLTSTDAGTYVSAGCFGETSVIRTFDDGGKDLRSTTLPEIVALERYTDKVAEAFGVDPEKAGRLDGKQGLLLPGVSLDSTEAGAAKLHESLPKCLKDTESESKPTKPTKDGPGTKTWEDLPTWGTK